MELQEIIKQLQLGNGQVFVDLLKDDGIKSILKNRTQTAHKILFSYFENHDDIRQITTIFLYESILAIKNTDSLTNHSIYSIVSVSIKNRIYELGRYLNRKKRLNPDHVLYIEETPSVYNIKELSKSGRNLVYELCENLSTLTDLQKTLIYKRIENGETIDSLSKEFGMSVATVKYAIKRGLEEMRKELKSKYGTHYKDLFFMVTDSELDYGERLSNFHTALIQKNTK
jgi:DNA-directed RNA polymerase specialized sigma24 family protein